MICILVMMMMMMMMMMILLQQLHEATPGATTTLQAGHAHSNLHTSHYNPPLHLNLLNYNYTPQLKICTRHTITYPPCSKLIKYQKICTAMLGLMLSVDSSAVHSLHWAVMSFTQMHSTASHWGKVECITWGTKDHAPL